MSLKSVDKTKIEPIDYNKENYIISNAHLIKCLI